MLERLKAVGAKVGEQDDVTCCYARQTKLWVTDPDVTMWEVYVLHADAPDWGEKHKKVKPLAAPFRALGVGGTVRRWWANALGRRLAPGTGTARLESVPEESADARVGPKV